MNKKNKIKIIVNGKQMTVKLKFSLKNLVDKLKLPIGKVAIELNRQILNKKNNLPEYVNIKFWNYYLYLTYLYLFIIILLIIYLTYRLKVLYF